MTAQGGGERAISALRAAAAAGGASHVATVTAGGEAAHRRFRRDAAEVSALVLTLPDGRILLRLAGDGPVSEVPHSLAALPATASAAEAFRARLAAALAPAFAPGVAPGTTPDAPTGDARLPRADATVPAPRPAPSAAAPADLPAGPHRPDDPRPPGAPGAGPGRVPTAGIAPPAMPDAAPGDDGAGRPGRAPPAGGAEPAQDSARDQADRRGDRRRPDGGRPSQGRPPGFGETIRPEGRARLPADVAIGAAEGGSRPDRGTTAEGESARPAAQPGGPAGPGADAPVADDGRTGAAVRPDRVASGRDGAPPEAERPPPGAAQGGPGEGDGEAREIPDGVAGALARLEAKIDAMAEDAATDRRALAARLDRAEAAQAEALGRLERSVAARIARAGRGKGAAPAPDTMLRLAEAIAALERRLAGAEAEGRDAGSDPRP